MTEPVMRNSLDTALRERAARVIPGGMWGHQKATQMPEGYPQFFARGEGPRVWDVDGNEYVDFMCSWGPIILGHRNPVVERAVEAQRAIGDCLDGPSEHLVDLAELMVRTIPHADWAMFQKNGSDATTACVTMARAATGRRKVLVARGSYHGAVPWCTPSLAGVTAFRHDIARDLEMPTRHFAETMRSLCDDAGAALILDDVRAGFRLHLGGSWETLGVRPDLAAWSKAIANGHALAAVTGGDRFREAAQKVFVTGSFWCSAVSMAAAKATIAELHALDAPAYLERIGNRLRDGLAAQSRAHGVAIRQSGPAQMPLVLFEADPDFAKGALFCRAALVRGTYLHHRHNMFLSTAHTDADIDRALAATDAAFAAVAAAGG